MWADLWAAGAVRTMGVLPERAAFLLGRLVARAAAARFPERRRLALANLRAAGFRNADCIYREMLGHLARDFALFSRLGRDGQALAQRWLRMEDGPAGGAVVATVHYSAWEFSMALAAARFPGSLAVAEPLPFPRLAREMERRRASAGGRVHLRGASLRPVLDALRRGALVGVAADLDPPPGRGVEVEFLGQRVWADDRAERIARAAGVPLYLASTSYEDGLYRLRFEPVAGAWAVMARLEQMIRRDPSQWIWMHDRWRRLPC